MKKLLPLLLLTLCLSVRSQITLDPSPLVSHNKFEVFSTSNLGEKYITWSNDTVIIYNSDWSLYRLTILPTGYSYQPFLSLVYNEIPSISDNLFNSDTLLEFLCSKVNIISLQNYTISVVNELGQIQYTFPDSVSSENLILYKINNEFKVSCQLLNYNNKIFSLPGTLPCNQCSYVSGIVEPTTGGGLSGLNVYPNPFNNSLEINYNFLSKQDNPRIIICDILGRELRTIPLVNQSDKITLNTSDLPTGTMVISLYGNGQSPVSKKVLKIN